MGKFEILCVTMHQTDFSKIRTMNIHSDVVFSNQADTTKYEEYEFEGHVAKMITTNTRGVGKNRNIGLAYASAEICLFADDDVTYNDQVEDIVVKEFEAHPDADVMIFYVAPEESNRHPISYPKTRRCRKFEKTPWGGVRIAFRLRSVQKANVWFTTLFGGGCIFPCGEDTMWIKSAKKAGLRFYVSKETIGTVCSETSTWFNGRNEGYYYGKGALCQVIYPRLKHLWILYYAYRTRKDSELKFRDRIDWMKKGMKGYKLGLGYRDFVQKTDEEKCLR